MHITGSDLMLMIILLMQNLLLGQKFKDLFLGGIHSCRQILISATKSRINGTDRKLSMTMLTLANK